jgi:hypothetical protein
LIVLLNLRLTFCIFSYSLYIIIHAILSQTTHTISIFLTIILALFRYISVCKPEKKNFFLKNTNAAIFITFVVAPLISIPIYTSLCIKEVYSSERNITLYKVRTSDNSDNYEILQLWVYSIIIKLIPCIALTYFSLQLIRSIYVAKRRKEKLIGNISIKLLKKKNQADRTTKMLIAVLILFLVTEFPQGIFSLLSAFLHKDFYLYCYQKLGDFFDFLALVNSSINFVLYCSMSTLFRARFKKIFLPKCLNDQKSSLMEMENRGNEETLQDTQMTQL